MIAPLWGCAAPAPDSQRARRQAYLEWAVARMADHEAAAPDKVQATAQHLEYRLAGKPEQAEITARRVLELD